MTLRKLMAATAVLSIIAGAAVAHDGATKPDKTAAASETSQANNYVGQSVYNAKGDEIGIIASVVTAKDGSQQAVISVGTFLGLGSKEIAVPVSKLSAHEGGGYQLSMSKEDIQSAPDYTPSETKPQ